MNSRKRKPTRPNRRPPPRPGGSAPVKTDWNRVAEWYDKLVGDEGSEFHREIIFPGVLRLLAVQPGDPVLDVACGQGAFCRVLHEGGFRATGVDASPELIQHARQRSNPAISFFIGDARELTFLRQNFYAAAACILSIQNIDRMQPVFEGAARALVPNGRLVIVMMHPCFRAPKATHWGWDDERKVQYRRVDRYLLPRKEPIVTHPGLKDGSYTWTFHRPLQSYFKAIRGGGLLVDAMEEWTSHKVSDSGPRAAAENVARNEIPLFLALRAVKPPPPQQEPPEEK